MHIQVEYLCDDSSELLDKIRLVAQDQSIFDIPITVQPPCANVSFPFSLDFGSIIQDGRVHTRTFELHNDGSKACDFSVVVVEARRREGPPEHSIDTADTSLTRQSNGVVNGGGVKSSNNTKVTTGVGAPSHSTPNKALTPSASSPLAPFTLRNATSRLSPRSEIGDRHAVSVDFIAGSAGEASCDLFVVIDGAVAGSIKVKAMVEGRQLVLLAPDSVTTINHVDLGCSYYNTTRTLATVLFNNSPDPAPFAVVPLMQSAWRHVGMGRVVDEEAAAGPICVSASPKEGTLLPREKRIIEFTFKSEFDMPSIGWKTQVCMYVCMYVYIHTYILIHVSK